MREVSVKPTRLDLYVAATMHCMPDVEDRLRLAGSSLAAARAVLELVHTLPFDAGILTRTRATVIDAFGPPLRTESKGLFYPLHLWPKHEYMFGFHENGACVEMQIIRTGSPPPIGVPPKDLVAVSRILRVGVDTEDDVRSWLGPPFPLDPWDTHWWPFARLQYGGTDPGPILTLDFEHRLLARVALRENDR